MGDIALVWGSGDADLAVVDDDLASDEGLRTAVLLSLFLDRRAEDDDALPSGAGDRRGWWADELAAVAGDRIGSRLWLLDRSTLGADAARRAEELAREALAWMVEDRVTDRIDVEVTAGRESLAYAVTIHRPVGDPVSFRFEQAWEGTA